MLPDHEFCDDCPGCRPAVLFDGEVLPPDDPVMIKINKVWDNHTTYAQRRSYIEVTLHNSRNPVDIRRMQEVAKLFQEEIEDETR